MCDETVDDSVGTLKFIHDWSVMSKMIKKLFTALYADETIVYFNEDSSNVVFNCSEMGILNVDIDNINLDNNFDELLFLSDFRLGILNLKNVKYLKKS